MRRLWASSRRLLWLLNANNIRKGFSQLRRGNLATIRSAIRNLIEHRAALDAAEQAAQFLHEPGSQFPPIEHDHNVPLVTVVIPCFNYGQYVGETVQSVLDQTFRNVEVIVVDGGSTDGTTPDVVRALAGPRVRVVLREGRHLAGDNRNFGLSLAASPYAACLDADDTLEPTFIEKALFLCEHAGFDIVSTALNVFGARSEKHIGMMKRPSLDDMVAGNQIYTCALLRRSLWRQAGEFYDYGLGAEHVAEDWDLWIRMLASGARVCNIAGEPLLNYRTHAQASLSSASDVPDVEQQRKRILDRNAALLTSGAFEKSRKAAATNLIVQTPSTNLAQRMLAAQPAGQRTIIVAVPFFFIGGAERLLTRVIKELIAAEWKVIVVSTVNQDAEHTDTIDWFKALTPEVYALPRFLHPHYWHAFVDYLLASRRVDAIMIAGSRFFYALLDAVHAQRPAIRVVDFLFNTVGHTEPHLEQQRHLSGVLCENEEVRAWCLRHGWRDDQIALVESRIDVASYSVERPAELAASLNIAPDDIVVGFSARLSEEKAPEVFVAIADLCRSNRNLKFVMTGTGRMKDEIERRIARLPADVQLQYLGVVDSVGPYFSLYDICVIPSHADGRPIAALEALASGCALVASNVGGLPVLIEDGVNGYLVPPGKPDAFAKRILALASDREGLNAMKRAARRFAEAQLDAASAAPFYAQGIEALTGVTPPEAD